MAEEVYNSDTEDIHGPIHPEVDVEETEPVPLTDENIDEAKSFEGKADVMSTDNITEDEKPKTTDYLESSLDDERDADPEEDELKAKEEYWKDDKTRKLFEEKYGDNAREEYDKMYDNALEQHRQDTIKATENAIVQSPMYAYDGLQEAEYRQQDTKDRLGPIGGGRYIDGEIVGQTKSVRQANIDSMQYLNDKNEMVQVKADDWLDLINEDEHTASDGRKIVAFEYLPFSPEDQVKGGLKAVYEGERPKGEVAGIHDLNGWWTSNVGLDSNAKIPRAVGKAIVNTVADLAIGATGVFNSVAVIMDADDDNAAIRESRDVMTHFEMYKMGTSDYDQANMWSGANMIDLTANIAAQLLLGGAIGKVAGGMSKILVAGQEGAAVKAALKTVKTLRKAGAPAAEIQAAIGATKVARAAHAAKIGSKARQIGKAQSAATITTLSLMGANEIRNEALNGGFSEDAAAGLFLAFLPAMYQANKISDLVINGDNGKYLRHVMKKTIRDEVKLVPKAAMENPKFRWAFAKKVSDKLNDVIAKTANTLSEGSSLTAEVAASSGAEAFEEVTEQFISDVMKTSANILAEITTPPGKDAPHMVGMYDAEYWKSAPVNYMMNAIGGAMGGTMARFAFGRQHSNALAFKSSDHDKLLKMVLSDDPTSLKIYEEELEKARKNGTLGSDKYSYERGQDGKLKLMAEVSPEEKDNTMSVAEANYRMRKLQLNHIKTIIGGYKGNYKNFVKQNPAMAKLLTDTNHINDNILKLHGDLETLYKDIPVEGQEAAENLPGPEEQAEVNAEADNVREQAKETKKTTDENTQITSNEKTTEPKSVNDTEYSEYESTFAGVLGVSPDKARKIIEKEQELKDVFTGKTAERDLINTIIKNDPARYGDLGSNPDELYKHMGNDILDGVVEADLTTHRKMQQRRADFILKKKEYEDSIDNLDTIDDARKLSELMGGDTKQFYVSPEKLQLLNSKLNDLADKEVTDKDTQVALDLLKTKLDPLGEEATAALFDDLMNGIQDIDQDDVVATKTWVRENAHDLIKLARSKYVSSMEKQGKSGTLSILSAAENTNYEQFLMAVDEEISQADMDMGIGGLFTLDAVYGQFLSKGKDLLISEEEATFTHIREPLTMKQRFTSNRSELEAEDAGSGASMFERMLYPTKDGVESGETTILGDVGRLKSQLDKSQSGIFTGLDEAKEGLAAAKLRKTQIELLFRLGDPYNKKELRDFTPADLVSAAGTIATLRDLNAKVLSQNEFRASVEDTKYSKFSKFISGWMLDPQKLRDLVAKGEAKTDAEKKQADKMKDTIIELVKIHTGLEDIIIPEYNNLIQVGKESQDEGAVSKKFKQSTVKYFEGLGDRVTKLGDVIQSDIVKSLGYQLTAITTEGEEKLAEGYAKYLEIAGELHTLQPEVKEAFIQELISTIKGGANNNDIIAMMTTDANKFYKEYGSILQTIKDNPDQELIVPTIDQEIASFQSYAFMIRDYNGTLNKAQRADPNYIKGTENFLWVPGSYGTGKTQVVFGMAATAAQSHLDKVDPQNEHKALLCANNVDQVNNLGKVGDKFGLKSKDRLTAKELLKELNRTDAVEAFNDTSFIIFDESTYLDFYEGADSQSKSTITQISEALNTINKARSKAGNPVPLTFMAIGDSKQGGWREDMPNLEGDIVSTGNTASNISTMNNIFGTKELVDPFRAFVNEIDNLSGKLKGVAIKKQMGYFGGAPVKGVKTFHNKTDKGYLGAEVVNTAKDLYTDELYDHLKARLEDKSDPDFTVLIVDESGSLPPNFQQLIDTYGGKKTVKFVNDTNKIKVKDIKGAQGLEASYVIVNTPSATEGWLPSFDSHRGDFYKYNLLSMLIGRARYYGALRVDSSVNISSESSESVKELKSSLTEFMTEWSDFRMSLLGTSSTKVDPDVIKPPEDINYGIGEEVVLMGADGTVVESAVVTEVQEDGTVIFKGKSGTEYEENYKTGEVDLGSKFVRSSENNKQVQLPAELTFTPGESISVYNMSAGYAQFGGMLMTDNAFVGRLYINSDGNRVAEIVDPNAQTPSTHTINLDNTFEESKKRPESLSEFTNVYRRAGSTVDNSVINFNDDALNSRAAAYTNYAMSVHGNTGTYNGKQVTIDKIEVDDTISATDSDGNSIEIPYDALGTDLLITKIENQNRRNTVRKALKDSTIHTEPPMGTVGPGDPSILEWADFEQTLSAALGKNEVFYEEIDDYISDISEIVENPDVPVEEKIEKVELLNQLQGLKLMGSPDTPYTENQLKVGLLISSGLANSKADEDSVQKLVEMEADGLGVSYSEVTKAKIGSEGLKGAYRSKHGFSRNLFGTKGQVPTDIELPGLTLRAMGLSKDGTAGAADFKFSVATYEYNYRDRNDYNKILTATTHAMVATTKDGKKFVIALFPTQMLNNSNSKITKILAPRAEALDKQSVEYHKNKSFSGIDGSTVKVQQGHVEWLSRSAKDKKSKKGPLVIEGKPAIYMETDITSAVLNGEVLLGNTTGGLVTASEHVRETLTNDTRFEQSDIDRDFLSKVNLKPGTDQQENDTIKNIRKYFKGPISDATVEDSKLVLSSMGGSKVLDYNGSKVIIVEVDNNRPIPFITHDGTEFTPFFGVTEDGELITDPDGTVVDNDTDLQTVKGILQGKGGGLDMNMTAMEVDGPALSGYMASALRYHTNFAEVQNGVTKWARFKKASNFVMNKLPKSMESVRIKLSELRQMTSDKEGLMTMSKPMVFRQSIGEGSAIKAGVPFVFYSFNEKHNLNDPSVIRGLEEKLIKFFENADDDAITRRLKETKDGIGIILMDFESHSMTDLLKKYKGSNNTDKTNFNRYVIPSGSAVNKRMLAFFTDIAYAIQTTRAADKNGWDSSKHTRLPALRASNIGEDGRPIRVLDENKIRDFQEQIELSIQGEDSTVGMDVLSEIFSIIDTITNDLHMGHFVTDRHDAYTDQNTNGNLFPGTDAAAFLKDMGIDQVAFKRGADSDKPIVHGYDTAPIVFIPAKVASQIVSEENYEPMKFNLEALFNMIERNRTAENTEAIDGALKVFDTLMQDHSLDRTLGLGIKVPPAAVSSNKTQLWYEFTEESGLEDSITTSVKDIKTPSAIYSIEGLAKALTPAKSKEGIEVALSRAVDKINTDTGTIFDSIVKNSLASLAKVDVSKPNIEKAINNKLVRAEKNLVETFNTEKSRILVMGGDVSGLTKLYQDSVRELKEGYQKRRPVKEHPIDSIRKGSISTVDQTTLDNSELISPGFTAKFNKLTNKLRYVADAAEYDLIKKELKALVKTSPDSTKYYENYLKPIYAGMDPEKGRLSNKKSINTVMELIETSAVQPNTLAGEDVEFILSSLEGLQDGATVRPENKTDIIEAWYSGDQDVKSRLEPYLNADIENPSDPVNLKFALYEAFTSDYPVQLATVTSVQTLKEANAEMHDQLMNNEDVAAGLLKIQPDNLVQIVQDFENDVNTVINELTDTDEKLTYLNSLNMVIEGLTSVLPESIITNMNESVKVARESVMNVRGQGDGPNLLGLIQKSGMYNSLSNSESDKGNNISQSDIDKLFTAIQEDVGKDIAILIKGLRGGKLSPEEEQLQIAEANLLGNAVLKVAKTVDQAELITKILSDLQEDPNCRT